MSAKSAGAGVFAVAKAQHTRESWVGVNLDSAPVFSAWLGVGVGVGLGVGGRGRVGGRG